MSEHFLDIRRFLGTNNISDLAAIGIPSKTGMYFYKVDNVDIDDDFKPHRRKGFGSAVYSGSSVRSLWANDRICLFADGTTFKAMNSYFNTFNLITGIDGTDTFAYADNGTLVYFSNTTIVGYVDTIPMTSYPFPDPSQNYKTKMVGGQCLEFYNSRLYAGHGNNLFFSDATIPTRMDTRKNAIAFPSRIRMVKAVDDGIYVSDSEQVYFFLGRDPITEFTQTKVLDIPAIEGMSVTGKAKGKIDSKITKSNVFWMTEKGPYAGYDTGEIKALQKGLFNVSGLDSGSAMIRDGTYQQLVMMGKF